MASREISSKTLGKDLAIVFGGFFFPLFKVCIIIISPFIVFNGLQPPFT
jgi:hypothetical protein